MIFSREKAKFFFTYLQNALDKYRYLETQKQTQSVFEILQEMTNEIESVLNEEKQGLSQEKVESITGKISQVNTAIHSSKDMGSLDEDYLTFILLCFKRVFTFLYPLNDRSENGEYIDPILYCPLSSYDGHLFTLNGTLFCCDEIDKMLLSEDESKNKNPLTNLKLTSEEKYQLAFELLWLLLVDLENEKKFLEPRILERWIKKIAGEWTLHRMIIEVLPQERKKFFLEGYAQSVNLYGRVITSPFVLLDILATVSDKRLRIGAIKKTLEMHVDFTDFFRLQDQHMIKNYPEGRCLELFETAYEKNPRAFMDYFNEAHPSVQNFLSESNSVRYEKTMERLCGYGKLGQSIIEQLKRLTRGAQSKNPYWMGSNEKRNAIIDAISTFQGTTEEELAVAVIDPDTVLHQSLNRCRLTRLTFWEQLSWNSARSFLDVKAKVTENQP